MRGNQILFTRDSECLQELLRLIRSSKHRAIVMWSFECLKVPVELLTLRYPNDPRPQNAFLISQDWAKGKIKMPAARKAILQVHGMAKELTNPSDAA